MSQRKKPDSTVLSVDYSSVSCQPKNNSLRSITDFCKQLEMIPELQRASGRLFDAVLKTDLASKRWIGAIIGGLSLARKLFYAIKGAFSHGTDLAGELNRNFQDNVTQPLLNSTGTVASGLTIHSWWKNKKKEREKKKKEKEILASQSSETSHRSLLPVPVTTFVNPAGLLSAIFFSTF